MVWCPIPDRMRRAFPFEAQPTAGVSKEPKWARSGRGMAGDGNGKSEGSPLVPLADFGTTDSGGLLQEEALSRSTVWVPWVTDGSCSFVQVTWPSGLLRSVTLETPALAPQSASTPSSFVLTEIKSKANQSLALVCLSVCPGPWAVPCPSHKYLNMVTRMMSVPAEVLRDMLDSAPGYNLTTCPNPSGYHPFKLCCGRDLEL